MKLLLILLLWPLFSYAENYVAVGQYPNGTRYTKLADCERLESDTCLDMTDKDGRYDVISDVQEDDRDKPIYSAKEAVQACSDEASCFALVQDVCTGEGVDRSCQQYCQVQGQPDSYFHIVAADYSEVYCTSITGFEQKWVKRFTQDAAAKAAADAADAAVASKDALMAARVKRIAAGEQIILEVMVSNDARALTPVQKAQVLQIQEVKDAMALLEVGNLEAGRSVLDGITPDGTLIRAEDKTAFLALIDAALAGL